jgi:hypothetical protein
MVRRLLQLKSPTPKNEIPKSCIVYGTVCVSVKAFSLPRAPSKLGWQISGTFSVDGKTLVLSS